MQYHLYHSAYYWNKTFPAHLVARLSAGRHFVAVCACLRARTLLGIMPRPCPLSNALNLMLDQWSSFSQFSIYDLIDLHRYSAAHLKSLSVPARVPFLSYPSDDSVGSMKGQEFRYLILHSLSQSTWISLIVWSH